MRSYSELSQIDGFRARFEYLLIGGEVGAETFGTERYLNQAFYRSYEWRTVRRNVISRDLGNDLGIEGYDIFSGLYVHHMNPVTLEQVKHMDFDILEPEFLITTSLQTHNAIHYGDENQLTRELVDRVPGDTTLW